LSSQRKCTHLSLWVVQSVFQSSWDLLVAREGINFFKKIGFFRSSFRQIRWPQLSSCHSVLNKHPRPAHLWGAQLALIKNFQNELWGLGSTSLSLQCKGTQLNFCAFIECMLELRTQGSLDPILWFLPNSGLVFFGFQVLLKRHANVKGWTSRCSTNVYYNHTTMGV
jgi:hypothetical protein